MQKRISYKIFKTLAGPVGSLSSVLSALLIFLLIPSAAAFAQSTVGPDTMITIGLCNVISLATGSFGAVVMSIAGLTALISAAMGSYKTTMSVIVVGVGVWLIEPMINLFFGFATCNGMSSSFAPIIPIGGLN